MKLKYIPLLAILLIGLVFVSGCTQTGQITYPSRTVQEQATQQQVQPQTPECIPNWQCGAWSGCSKSGTQTRNCADANDCGTTSNMPLETQSCIPPCIPNWQCTVWSECSSFGRQTRTCTDQNNCEATISKPTESQSCTQQIIESSGQETTHNESTIFVYRVIDGDSIELSNNMKVRLLGINTPERGQPYYQEATNRLKELVEGKNVVLENDVQDKDQYGRLLRYVFVDNLFVNLQLVKEGYANVYVIQPNTQYEISLRDAENEAKTSELNLWKQPTGENICDNRCIGISYSKWDAEGNDCDNLNGEYVAFVNTCSYSCDLTSWTVKDESSRNPYVFPTFVLENGKTVTLYTGCGTNTETQLYWCSSGYSCNAIWNNDGDTLYVRNSNGGLVLDYPYT